MSRSLLDRSEGAQSNSRHEVPCLFICLNRHETQGSLCTSRSFLDERWMAGEEERVGMGLGEEMSL